MENMNLTMCQNNILTINVDTNSSQKNNEGQQSRQPLADIKVFSTSDAASINFRTFTSISTTLQSSAFENQSIYQGAQLNYIPRSTVEAPNALLDFPLASITATIANSIASAITTTAPNNSFVLPELIPIAQRELNLERKSREILEKDLNIVKAQLTNIISSTHVNDLKQNGGEHRVQFQDTFDINYLNNFHQRAMLLS